jgi:hypothetical protein
MVQEQGGTMPRRIGHMALSEATARNVRKIYGKEELWDKGEEEAERLGLLTPGGEPSISRFTVMAMEFYFESAAVPESLAARAVSDGKGTRERIRAALTVSDGSRRAAAEVLKASDRDLRRAIEVLDLGPEIEKRWGSK